MGADHTCTPSAPIDRRSNAHLLVASLAEDAGVSHQQAARILPVRDGGAIVASARHANPPQAAGTGTLSAAHTDQTRGAHQARMLIVCSLDTEGQLLGTAAAAVKKGEVLINELLQIVH